MAYILFFLNSCLELVVRIEKRGMEVPGLLLDSQRLCLVLLY